VISPCDCSSVQRAHPGHAALHAALDELLMRGELEIVGRDERGKTIYRKADGTAEAEGRPPRR
jgi:hypothetical protein